MATGKRLLLLLALLLALLSLAAVTAGAADNFLLSRGQAGLLKVGLTIDELYARYGRANTRLVDLYPEGLFAPALAIYLDQAHHNQPSLTAEIGWQENWVVSRIIVHDPRFKTREGLGVGSTLADIRKAFPVKEITYEEGQLSAVVEQLRMSFGLSKKNLPRQFFTTGNRNLIPAATRVNAIIIY